MTWTKLVARKLLRMPQPRISREDALRIALQEMTRRGEKLRENHPHFQTRAPLVQEALATWRIWLDPDFRPSRIVVVDNQTGGIRRYVIGPC